MNSIYFLDIFDYPIILLINSTAKLARHLSKDFLPNFLQSGSK